MRQTESTQLAQATSSTTASEVTKMMVATVESGTAGPAAIPGIQVAGKTGTAQSGLTQPNGEEVPPYAWFVGFAPANAPKVAVAVMIQHVDRAHRRDPRRHPRRTDRQVGHGGGVELRWLTRHPTHPSGPPSYADDARRYRLDSRIASGGMGEVWLGTDTVLDRLVAVKLLKQEHADDAVFRSRFETEAQHAAALHHPGVAQVFDFGAGDHEHRPYLVLEYVDGRPLSAILRPGQPMDASAAAQLIAATADALGAAHAQGIVHRDVKPANILVTDDRQVKITDFGIARAADAVALTGTGEVLGTPQYISPEQAQGRRATPASDVYSLGAVAFECLVGRRPYEADSPVATAIAHLRQPVPELPDTVPPALASVVRRAMAKSPEERYAGRSGARDGRACCRAGCRRGVGPGRPRRDEDPGRSGRGRRRRCRCRDRCDHRRARERRLRAPPGAGRGLGRCRRAGARGRGRRGGGADHRHGRPVPRQHHQ